ncbi:MAG: DUF4369 domain-containing protein, partial [Bacteroidota bacterium]
MKPVVFLCASYALIAGCSGDGQKSAISGNIADAGGQTIYLERYVNNRGVITDSTVIASDGSFVIKPAQPLEK